VVQLLAASVMLCAVYIVMTPTRSALLSYPEQPSEGAQLHPSNTFSEEKDREFQELRHQDNGELDFDVSTSPLEEQVSNMDVSVSVVGSHAQAARQARSKRGGLTGHHALVDGVSASWARDARTSALAQTPQQGKMQQQGKVQQLSAAYLEDQLSAAYLEDQGINTGAEYNHLLDHRVPMGQANPSVFFAAAREVPDLQPNPPATAYPKPPLNKLTNMGVYTGTEHTQWDDTMVKSNGMEEPYSFGASPTRERDSPARRAGSWGIFKPRKGSMGMLAQEAQVDLEQVLAQKAELEQKAHVKVDSFPDVESNLPEHMKISADPRDAWTKPPPSNGNLKNAGVNTGEEHHDLGDVHVERGQVSPVHVSLQHNLASAGVNTGDDNLIHVDKGPEVYVPDSVPTATPRKTTGKLDKLGVNTGNKHTQWGDSLVSHEGLEASYNIGPSPNREFTSATPFPGTTNWAAKGSRAVKLASAHDFFKTSVKPLMLPNNRHAIATAKFEAKEPTGMAKLAAQPYIIEADAAKARAAEAESALARDVVRARKAEWIATKARKQALKVGLAAAKVAAAKEAFAKTKHVFSEKMAEATLQMPHTKATRQKTKEIMDQAKLDSDTKKDLSENQAKATSKDLGGFFSSVNSNSNDRTNGYQQPHMPAVEPNEAGPMSDIVSGKKSAQQQLRAKPHRSRAAAAAHHKALQAHHKGIAFSRNELCAVSVWGVHPLCPDAFDAKYEPLVNV